MSILRNDDGDGDWIKVDLHIHTLDDPKDVIDYSAHQLLERAQALGFGVLAITLHDAVFDRQEVFADAAAMGILLIPAAEVRLCGADVIVLNVTAGEIAALKSFDDLRQLRARRGMSIFAIAPHPFYVLGGSIGPRNRGLPFSQGSLEPESAGGKGGGAIWQALDRHFRCAPVECFRPSLHQHPASGRTHGRKCFRGITQRPVAPDESAMFDCRSCQRDLLHFPRASVSKTATAIASWVRGASATARRP